MAAHVKRESVSPSESSDGSTSRSSSAEPSAEMKKDTRVKKELDTNGETSESEHSSGSSESESEEEKPNVQDNSAGNKKNDDGSDSSSSESESEEEPTPAPSQQPMRGPANTTVQSAQNYKPPSGFKHMKQQSLPSSATSSVLSNTRGKQVFHITAPASLPLSKVKEVSFAKVLQGEPVLTHDGVSYGIPPDNISQGDSNDQKLFLYDPGNQMYYSSPAGNIQSYHIQELISLPTTQNDSAPVPATQEPAKPVKKQPKHLKMRFRPVGSSSGPAESIGSSSDESDGEQPAFRMSKGAEKKERKRKHHAEGEGSRKKSKKHSSPEMERRPSSSHKDEADGHHKSKKSSKHRSEKKRIKAEETY